MNDELAAAYIKLLALFEGGSAHWFEMYQKHGALELIEMIEGGYFKSHKKIGERLQSSSAALNISEKLEEFSRCGAFLVTRSSTDWPARLDDLSAPPIALVARGARSALGTIENSLSIVGTRNPSPYGVRVAGDFAAGAADREWTVVSGGALGIDSAAHNGALVAEGSTIAILANGVGLAYPPSNHRLFSEIVENGLLLSEVLPTVHAVPSRFLTRNRLIAAISRATVVVEAAFRSGSLRTARDASEILRPVMAVPGPITSPTSDGCHRLIGERSAEIVTSIADLMELVGPLS